MPVVFDGGLGHASLWGGPYARTPASLITYTAVISACRTCRWQCGCNSLGDARASSHRMGPLTLPYQYMQWGRVAVRPNCSSGSCLCKGSRQVQALPCNDQCISKARNDSVGFTALGMTPTQGLSPEGFTSTAAEGLAVVARCEPCTVTSQWAVWSL